MLWIMVGLFAVGAACGTSIRLPIFVGVLIAGAFIVGIASSWDGLGGALWVVPVTMIALQIGYVVGLVLRAIAPRLRAPTPVAGKSSAGASLGTKQPWATIVTIRGSAADRDARRRDPRRP
jgi:hypothetical protein